MKLKQCYLCAGHFLPDRNYDMNGLHLHLMLNHLPIFGLAIGAIWLLIALLMRNKTLTSAGLLTLLVVGLMTIPVYLTGEPAEHTIGDAFGVSEHALEEHEELGLIALIATLVTGIAAGASWWLNRSRSLNGLNWAVFGVAVLSFPILAITNNHGGQIRRPELQEAHAPDGTHIEGQRLDQDQD
jgi:uncharacterized membrane protein